MEGEEGEPRISHLHNFSPSSFSARKDGRNGVNVPMITLGDRVTGKVVCVLAYTQICDFVCITVKPEYCGSGSGGKFENFIPKEFSGKLLYSTILTII